MNPTFPLPHISVIIPTYNRPDYLKLAIQSVLDQTYPNLEIIIADDHSDRDPRSIVDAFRPQLTPDRTLQLQRHPHNLGVGQNTATAATSATGQYIAFLNDDDTWHPDFLATLIPPLETHPDLILSFCDHYIIQANGDIDPTATTTATHTWKRDRLAPGIHQPFHQIGLLDQSVYAASAAVIRRTAIDWSRLAEAGVYWDYFIVYLTSRTLQGAYYCPDRLAYYRVHPNSETTLSGPRDAQAKIRKGYADIACQTAFMNDPALAAFRPTFKQKWVHASTTLGIGLLRNGQPIDARPILRQALRASPLNPRTLIACCLSYLPTPIAQPLLYPSR